MRWLAELDLAPPPAPKAQREGGGSGKEWGRWTGGCEEGRRAQAEAGRSRPQWGARGKAHRRGEGGGHKRAGGGHISTVQVRPPDVMDLVKPGCMV